MVGVSNWPLCDYVGLAQGRPDYTRPFCYCHPCILYNQGCKNYLLQAQHLGQKEMKDVADNEGERSENDYQDESGNGSAQVRLLQSDVN